MATFLIRRFAQSLLVILFVSFTVFVLSRTTGDPANLLLPLDASQEQRQEFAQKWGLDRPLYEQFVAWVTNVARGDFGTSYRARVPVWDLIMSRLPNSLYLGFWALTIAAVVGISTGVVAAVRRGTWLDGGLRMLSILGQGVPAFWLALVLQLVFALKLPIFPVSGADEPLSVVLPALTLGWFISAGIMRLTRSAMLGALSSDYVLLARSKGLDGRTVVVKHALRNALIAPITFLGVYVGVLIGSAVIVEHIFAWPGIGSLAYQSVLVRDFPTLQGVILVVTIVVVITSFLIDIAYAVIDPRIRG